MIVTIKAMSRYSDTSKDEIKTVSTSYSTTIPLDFSREEAAEICCDIISQEFTETYGAGYKRAGQRIATLDGITESFSNDQYCFSVGGDVHLIEEKDVEIDY